MKILLACIIILTYSFFLFGRETTHREIDRVGRTDEYQQTFPFGRFPVDLHFKEELNFIILIKYKKTIAVYLNY